MRRILILITLLFTTHVLAAQENTTLNQVVNTLKERISLAGYAQTGYTYDDFGEKSNAFDVKRIIFMANGQITNKWSCSFMYNFANGGDLLEIYTEYKFLPQLTARVGQFKTMFSIESPMSPTTVELVNCCSQAVAYLAGFNNPLYEACGGRDIGLLIYGDLFKKLMSYNFAIMNGQGINVKDKNNQKDIVGSLMVNPLKWLSVGGSFIKGKGNAVKTSAVAPDIQVGDNYTRDRWALGAVITTRPIDIRTEYLAGKDGKVNSEGYYITTSAHILPKFDIIASYDYLNKDKKSSNFKQTNYVAGVQYWFYPKCRLQAQYTFCDRYNGESSNLIQAQIQVRF